MASEINNAKCAQHLLDCMEGIDFPTLRNTKFCQEWISVKDRLPNNESAAFVYDKVFGMQIGFFLNETGWDCNDRDVSLRDVSHWMPFPELPHE